MTTLAARAAVEMENWDGDSPAHEDHYRGDEENLLSMYQNGDFWPDETFEEWRSRNLKRAREIVAIPYVSYAIETTALEIAVNSTVKAHTVRSILKFHKKLDRTEPHYEEETMPTTEIVIDSRMEKSVVTLQPHPLNARVYGDTPEDTFVDSVRSLGILTPLLIDQDNTVLSGHRRLAAAKKAGLETVPVEMFHGTALEAEQVVIESNRQREKTAGQKAREAHELLRIQRELAAERMKSGKAVTLGPEVAKGRASDKVAETTGQSRKTVEMQDAIVEAANQGQPEAVEALAQLDAGAKTVTGAYKAIETAKQPEKLSQVAKVLQRVERLLTARGLEDGIHEIRNRTHTSDTTLERYKHERYRLAALLREKANEFLGMAEQLESEEVYMTSAEYYGTMNPDLQAEWKDMGKAA